MDQQADRPITHVHGHFHRTTLPLGHQRAASYWHRHEHQHAEPVSEPDDRHAARPHDHAHDQQAFSALTVMRRAA